MSKTRPLTSYEQFDRDLTSFDYTTDCDVFTILSKSEKRKTWKRATIKLRKDFNKFLSQRKKSCKV